MATPLAWSFTVLMIGAAASVLLERDPLGEMLWLVPLAIAGASVWTTFTLQRVPAQLLLRGDDAAVQSIWDCATGSEPRYKPLANPRRQDGLLFLPLGRSALPLDPDDWPEFEDIMAALVARMGAPDEGSGDIPLKSASLDPFSSTMP
ncbi:hypothetical protein BH23BAC4_BH23BAC4_14000 [soil metagenome]